MKLTKRSKVLIIILTITFIWLFDIAVKNVYGSSININDIEFVNIKVDIDKEECITPQATTIVYRSSNSNYLEDYYAPYYYCMEGSEHLLYGEQYALSSYEIDLILEWSDYYNLDPHVVIAMYEVESKWDEYAKGPGSLGTAQIIKQTAEWVAIDVLKLMTEENFDWEEVSYNPDYYIPVSTWLLNYNLKVANGDLKKALMFYNGNAIGERYWHMVEESLVKNIGATLEEVQDDIKVVRGY